MGSSALPNSFFLLFFLLLFKLFLNYFFEGMAQLLYTQPPATCTVMGLYTSAHNERLLSSCRVETPDRPQCTLTCTNAMPNPIPRLRVAVLPNCDYRGIGVQITTEGFDGGVLQSGTYYSNTTVPLSFLSSTSGAYVVTVGHMSTTYVIFEVGDI